MHMESWISSIWQVFYFDGRISTCFILKTNLAIDNSINTQIYDLLHCPFKGIHSNGINSLSGKHSFSIGFILFMWQSLVFKCCYALNFCIFFLSETPERGRPKGHDSTKMTKCGCFVVHFLCWHVCVCGGRVCWRVREWWLFVYPNVIFNKNSEFSFYTDKNDKKIKGFSSSENGKNATLKCYFPHIYFAINFFLFTMYYCWYMFNRFAQ